MKRKKRTLTAKELKFLCVLWKWKVLTRQLAHELAFSDIGPWQVYRTIFRLLHEGYISEHSVMGCGVNVLQLTKKGFSEIHNELGDLKELRFNPQSVTHDHWATAFQLGPFVKKTTDNVNFIAEQEVQAFDPGVMPEWISPSREHIPDGFTCIKGKDSETHIALEVELNLKSSLRYDKVAYYFDGIDSKIDLVFWLCANINIAETIFNHLVAAKLRRLGIHHFFIADDFRKLGCQTPARTGQFRTKTIEEILIAKEWQNNSSTIARQWQNEINEIFFPQNKSPQKKKA